MIEKMRFEEASNLNALASSRSREYFSGTHGNTLNLNEQSGGDLLPKLDLNFEFSRVEDEYKENKQGDDCTPVRGEDVRSF
jgi:hypothetical protein